jgi:hypothetical protein
MGQDLLQDGVPDDPATVLQDDRVPHSALERTFYQRLSLNDREPGGVTAVSPELLPWPASAASESERCASRLANEHERRDHNENQHYGARQDHVRIQLGSPVYTARVIFLCAASKDGQFRTPFQAPSHKRACPAREDGKRAAG